MPFGIDVMPMPASWGDRLIQLASSVTDMRERKRKKEQQDLENTRQAEIDKRTLQRADTENEASSIDLEKKRRRNEFSKSLGIGQLGVEPIEGLKKTPSTTNHFEDEALLDPSLRDSLGYNKQSQPTPSTATPSNQDSEKQAYKRFLGQAGPVLEPEDYLSNQRNIANLEEKENFAIMKYGKDGDRGNVPFEPGSDEYRIAEYIAQHNIPPSEWTRLYSGLGKIVAGRSKLFSTVINIKPDYDWIESSADFRGALSHAEKAATLTPDIIGKEGELTHTRAMAQMAPDVTEAKVDRQARGQTAKTINIQRQAAQRAISTLDDAKELGGGKYENIPEFMYSDLALDYAKVMSPGGQVGVELMNEIKQKSGKAALVGVYNWISGDTKTTAPEQVLSLLHDRLKALKTDLDKQYYNQLKGENIPVNSDEATNPLSSGGGSSKGSWSSDKESRYQELMKKKQAGILGK